MTFKVPVSVPDAAGVNVMLRLQLAPAATLDPQVLVSAKSAALVPVSVTLVMESAAAPVFVSVTVFAALVDFTSCTAKVRVVGESVTLGAVPVPVRGTVCGLPAALSVRLRAAVRVPVAVGLNVILNVQLLPTAKLVVQVVVSLKSPLLVPVKDRPLKVSVALPELVSVTFCALLLVPTC